MDALAHDSSLISRPRILTSGRPRRLQAEQPVLSRNAPLTVLGRQRAVAQVIGKGRPIAHVAAEFHIARATLSKWVSRYRDHGVVGLEDRSSAPAVRPSRCPTIVISAVVVPGPVSVLVMGAIPQLPTVG